MHTKMSALRALSTVYLSLLRDRAIPFVVEEHETHGICIIKLSDSRKPKFVAGWMKVNACVKLLQGTKSCFRDRNYFKLSFQFQFQVA